MCAVQKIECLNLRASKITDLLIEDRTITDLDLGGCPGTRIELRNCRLETLDVTCAALADVDIRQTTLRALTGLEGMRGVTIDDYQFSLFAPLFATTSVPWSIERTMYGDCVLGAVSSVLGVGARCSLPVSRHPPARGHARG